VARENCSGIAGTRGTNKKTAGKQFPAVFPGVIYPGGQLPEDLLAAVVG
jgi:hypothetical protein